MFLDDELKQIWDNAVQTQEQDYKKVCAKLMEACFNRLEGDRNSVKRVASSYNLFAKAKGLNPMLFPCYYIANARANKFSEDQIKMLCKDLGWDYSQFEEK